MLDSLLSCASPFSEQSIHDTLLNRKSSFSIVLAQNLLQNLKCHQVPLWVIEALICISDRSLPNNSNAWAPEIPSILQWLADTTLEPPYFKIELYAVRLSGFCVQGKFSNTASPGFGSFNGIPARYLKNQEFIIKQNTITFRETINENHDNVHKISTSMFLGDAVAFKETINNGYDTSSKLTIGNFNELDMLNRLAINELTSTGVLAEWVTSAITSLYVTEAEKNSFSSGSWDKHCGLSYCSLRDEVFQLADILLHEACHQNFYFINLNKCLHEDDGILRLSPAVNLPRPIWAILLAYHAFSNVSIFYYKANYLQDEMKIRHALKNFDYAVKAEEILNDYIFTEQGAKIFFESLKSIFSTVKNAYLDMKHL
ncbi:MULTISPECIES: HEXXH motif-containing putative peptide modification protein [unclassified Pantoea]|uniref:HEXXH motif-containing putative peptide modification protein n=1 Tax=unclassified Pantoea TaxID=2630326 RepID=UPI001CD3F7AD|nr:MULTISPECIES: HEXXH motif-containing putative peptide modification protein [unclassified Pantoea]MCA1174828.1 hypothetical protein [Pantoea sp. alder69]MCA1253924.1 hypothetical protein [Pantoea sp. alder70]MCA1264255.1 hypothetical protein [Pantoea sp. alder81]